MLFIDYLKKNDLNVSILSKLTKIPYATLHKGIDHPSSLKAENLSKVSQQLSLSMDEVFSMLAYEQMTNSLQATLIEQRMQGADISFYRTTQLDFAHNTNSIENNMLTYEQTASVFDTDTIAQISSVSDIIATANHFYLFDIMLDEVFATLSESLLQRFALILTNASSRSDRSAGKYKGRTDDTASTTAQIKSLLVWYNSLPEVTFQDILEFHVEFLRISPFARGNGALARMIMFKECLRSNNIPFIMDADYKAFYHRGINKHDTDTTFLSDVCLIMQDNYLGTITEFLGEGYTKELNM